MDVDEVLAKIRAERLERGIKQSVVAERMGVSQSFIQALEYRRNVDRRWGTIMAYAAAVGVPITITVGDAPEPE